MNKKLIVYIFILIIVFVIFFSLQKNKCRLISEKNAEKVGLRSPIYTFFKDNLFLTSFNDTKKLTSFFRKSNKSIYEYHSSNFSLPNLNVTMSFFDYSKSSRYFICVSDTQCAETILFKDNISSQKSFNLMKNTLTEKLSSNFSVFSSDPYLLTSKYFSYVGVKFYSGFKKEISENKTKVFILYSYDNIVFLYSGTLGGFSVVGRFHLLNTTKVLVSTPSWIKDTVTVSSKTLFC